MKTHHSIAGLLVVSLAACNGGTASDAAASGTAGTAAASKSVAKPASSSEKPATASAKPATSSSENTVASGTAIELTLRDSISSRNTPAGTATGATVSHDIVDSKGRVLIPAGSPAALSISAISPSKAGDNNAEGVLELTVTSLTVRGVSHNLTAVVRDIPHTMKGRGVTKGQAEDVAVGAAVGAIAGQVIGKNTKSTVIGGAAGAAVGAGVAVAGAQRDIVVAAGTHITFSLPQSITVAAR